MITYLFKLNETVTSEFIVADKITASTSTRRSRSAFINTSNTPGVYVTRLTPHSFTLFLIPF